MFQKKHVWAVLWTLALGSFTVYLALDTFVIERVYAIIPESQDDGTAQEDYAVQDNDAVQDSDAAQEDRIRLSRRKHREDGDSETDQLTVSEISEDSYRDQNVSITLKKYTEYGTSIYVADIQVSSAKYLKTAFARNAFGRNITAKTSEIAQSANAVLAINGDFCGSRESGYVVRNGVVYRDVAAGGQEDLAIYEDGSFRILTEDSVAAADLETDGAVQVFSFGPALIQDGKIAVSEGEEVGKAKASNPRTAIGMVGDLHYVFVVSDGRTSESQGLSLSQLAKFMQGLGVKAAYNLDGGGSSTMYWKGEVVNHPTSSGRSIKERGVSDIVYIGS